MLLWNCDSHMLTSISLVGEPWTWFAGAVQNCKMSETLTGSCCVHPWIRSQLNLPSSRFDEWKPRQVLVCWFILVDVELVNWMCRLPCPTCLNPQTKNGFAWALNHLRQVWDRYGRLKWLDWCVKNDLSKALYNWSVSCIWLSSKTSIKKPTFPRWCFCIVLKMNQVRKSSKLWWVH